MPELTGEAQRLFRQVEKIRSENKEFKDVFERYLKHEHYLLRSAMPEKEEMFSRNAFVRAYGRELHEFQRLVDEVAGDLGLGHTGAREEVYGKLGIAEVMKDYEESLNAPESEDPLHDLDTREKEAGLAERQKNGIYDFHKWLYRNCDKSGYAYLGSAGSVREYADAFTKKPGKDQLRALYIVQHGLGEAEGAVELADAALDSYVPDLAAIKDKMIRSKFHVFSRMDGTRFRWDRLSSAVSLVEEENGKVRDLPENDQNKEQSEADAQIARIAEENHVPEEQVKETVGALGEMRRELGKLNAITAGRPKEDAAQEQWDEYLRERNEQLKKVRESSGRVLKELGSGSWKDKFKDVMGGAVETSDFILNLTYAYDVAAQCHTATKGFKMNVKDEDELESVFSSIYQACGGKPDDKVLMFAEGGMDIGLGLLTAVSSGAAAIADINQLLEERNVVRRTENVKRSVQVTQDIAYTVGGVSDTVGTISSFFQTAKDLEETAKYTGSTAKIISDSAGTISGVTGLVAGSADMVMGSLDVCMGGSQHSRAVNAKKNAARLNDKVKKAEIRGAAKTVKRKNKWKIGQGVLTFLKGAAGVVAGGLAFTAGFPVVAAVAAAVGSTLLASQLFYTNHKERIGNNRKAIDANILAKEREINGLNRERNGEKKKTRAIEDLVEARKAKLRERMNRLDAGSRQHEYLSKMLNDDKRLKHAIRTEAAVKMGCLTQEDCRQKLDMKNVEQAFRHVYLKDPDGEFTAENIITESEAREYFVSEKSKIEELEKAGVDKEKDPAGKVGAVTKEQAVERLTYRDILKGYGFRVEHHSKAEPEKLKENMEKAKSSMEK